MFGSRRKGKKQQYTPPTAASVNPSAATAAVSAYNLSSAAAAAALKALPTPPTNVAAVQTKRTMRRSASVSSEGSRRPLSPVPSIKRAIGFGGNKDTREGVVVSPTGAPTLRRRGSSSSIKSMSSMTERTFRSPSPHNPRAAAALAAATASPNGSVTSNKSLSMNAAGTAAAMAAGRSTAAATGGGGISNRSRSMPPTPPVPVIPKHVFESQPKQQRTKQAQVPGKRASTLGFVQQPLRLASQKQKEGRSSWFSSAVVGNIDDVRTSDAPMDINGYAQQPERPGSRSSLQNFSYPSRQRLGSPPPSPTLTRASTAAPAAAAPSTVSLPPVKNLTRSASTERVPQQPASQPKAAATSARRSASTSRVTGRSKVAPPDMTLVYDPNSRRMVPRAELLMLEQSIHDSAEKPQRQQRKKKQQQGAATASLAGAHLSQGTITHAHGTAAPLNRAEVQRAAQEQAQTRLQKSVQQPAQVQAPQAPQSPPPERQLPKISTAIAEPQELVQEAIEDKDFEEPTQPLPALSTSASTPSSSVSSLTALTASQLATSPVTIQSVSSPEDGGFEGTLLTEDGRPVLVKRPSIVREEPDLEEEEEKRQGRQQTARAQSQPQLSTAAAVVAAAGSRTARDGLDGVSAKQIHHHDAHSAPQQEQQLPAVAVKEQGQERTRSNSPVRTAHFAPIVGSNLTVRRHSPPPRSISPRKSALKHTGNRDASPSDSASEANPTSDTGLHNRKKANRVSFDDKAVVVSQSPLPPSPPHSPGLSSLPGASEAPQNSHTAHQPPSRSRSWFSNIGRSKKKTDFAATGADDDDGVMKPRPALPSFGSVRDKSHASQPEERPLVRPASETQPSRQTTQPPSTTTSAPLESHSTSSDHAIGFIVGASPQGVRNTANTSRYREPLPPVVTSVDGSGYVSDSGDSSNGDEEVSGEDEEHSPVLRFDEEQDTTVPATLDEPIIPSAPVEPDADPIIILPGPSSPTNSPKKTVPAIAISHPSQENLTAVRGTENDEEVDEDEVADEQFATMPAVAVAPPKSSPVRSLFDVPGTFPMDSESDGTSKSSPTHASFATVSNQPVPTRQNAFEPIVQDDDNSYSPHMPATVFATHMPTLHEETSLRNEKLDDDDSDSEVFSDAYEDLSDIEGDGFLSLDAVVDSPIVPDLTKSPFATSSLTGSPPRKSEVLQLGPSPLAKEDAPASLTETPSTAVDATGAPATTAAVAAGGAVIGMAALATTAMNKQLNGAPAANPENEEDWDKIKAFWRGLTTEKRAQLEKEAREEAAAEGDLEDETAAADKKPRRKKSVETRIAEKKAIQELAPARQEAVAPPVEHQSQKSAATRIRRSMRDNANPAAGGSGSLAPPHPSTLQKERVASAFPPKAAVGAVMRPAPKMHSRTLSADSSASSTQGKSGVTGLIPSALRRRGSDSSESSFKRFRSNSNGAASGAAAGAANFRMSMRGNGKAAAASSNGLDHRSSRFSLRSLSPTGSTTLHGSAESSPAHFRRSMRDGIGSSGFAASEMKRMSLPPTMATSTLRKGAAADSGGGFFSSLGKKRGSKLLQRNNDGGGKSGRSRFDSSDEDDEDIFGPSRATNGAAAARRSASAGGAYTFRSRFVDSSDEDEVVPNNRTVDTRKNNKEHVVPKTLRTGSSMRSASARPASSSTPKSPPLPEELEEEEEEEAARANYASSSALGVGAAGSSSGANNVGKNNLGTSTLRRSRSGRGQIAPVSPMYSPTTTGAVGLNNPPMTPTRRSSGIMSVLRRKKTDGPASPTSLSNSASGNKIQRAQLVDSAARRDTQLERSSRELAAVRSNSRGSQGRRATNRADEDSDDDEDGAVGPATANGRRRPKPSDSWPLPGPSTNGQALHTVVSAGEVNIDLDVSEMTQERRKKKFSALRRMFRLDD
ncbi:hypothetical protein SEUCBS140593_007436 [Sporothrix eucalyptigena]|uniref:Uncharacterized protein n=1 Tax=Sporothrix eucalyptigena TaxID=1812306 RepID=A0ABP0CDJ3_9PEZI